MTTKTKDLMRVTTAPATLVEKLEAQRNWHDQQSEFAEKLEKALDNPKHYTLSYVEAAKANAVQEAISIAQQHEVDLEVCVAAYYDVDMMEYDSPEDYDEACIRAVLTAAGVKWRG